jgi:hypothetical protein
LFVESKQKDILFSLCMQGGEHASNQALASLLTAAILAAAMEVMASTRQVGEKVWPGAKHCHGPVQWTPVSWH